MAKVHLRANKLTGTNRPVALCAALSINGKIHTNKRTTYRFMASEVVGFEDFKATPDRERCAHCCAALPAHNVKRVALGLQSREL